MEIKIDEDFISKISDALWKPSTPTTRIYITDMCRCLTAVYFDKTEPLPSNDLGYLYMGIGIALHEYIEKLFLTSEIPISKDGINGRMDAFMDYPIEIKTTFKSSNKTPQSWINQLKAYCVLTETDKGKIIAVHFNGDYRPPGKPKILVYSVSFSDNELASFKDEMNKKKNILLSSFKTKKPPYDFYSPLCEDECKYCKYKKRCPWGEINSG